MTTKHSKTTRPFAVVVRYECKLGERGTVVSRHGSYELAIKAAKRTGYDSFLQISETR